MVYNSIDDNVLNEMLESVQKPARYTGREVNAAKPKDASCRVALCFPDTYEVGMSHVGMRILYHRLNTLDYATCERLFTPWGDMAGGMRKRGEKLFTLEGRAYVDTFDVLAFTIPYEMCYTNILETLDLSRVPLRSAERGEDAPIVIAGGVCTYNPAPLNPFIDCFFVGDGEDAIVDIARVIKESKERKLARADTIRALAAIDGMYAPACHDGTRKVTRRFVADLDGAYFPKEQIVPYIEIVHDRASVELFRGCTRGCRFCQAGMLYRPIRERSPDTIARQACDLIDSTGYDELSLSSLSTGDYTRLDELHKKLDETFKGRRVEYSLPSLRLDSELGDAISMDIKTATMTFAPEAGTQRLRDIINKGITEEHITSAVESAVRRGVSTIKLYFMIGHPGETMEDIEGIADLALRISNLARRIARETGNRPPKVSASVAPFVPKPFTPFQWFGQDTIETTNAKIDTLKRKTPPRAVSLHWHDPKLSRLEAVFARGDERLAYVIELAYRRGATFDGWTERFSYDLWVNAFADSGVSMDEYANRERNKDEQLPWDFIDAGVTKEFLWREKLKADASETTKDCRGSCLGCGVQRFKGVCSVAGNC